MNKGAILLSLINIWAFGCKTTTQNTNDKAPSANLGSCLGLANGNKSRCFEYTSGKEMDAARKICGDESKGLKGYNWTNSPCPHDNRVGSCAYSEPGQAHATEDFWYAPSYTRESAKSNCLFLGGKFSSL